MMRVLGIETSCDETAAAVVDDQGRILSNVIYSQVEAHRAFGGIVPELASREHIRKIRPIVSAALDEAGVALSEIDGIAATYGPGLVGSLLVGLTWAKAAAYAANKPLIGVDHIEGHIYSVYFEHPGVEFPALALIVSGGHTNLFWIESESGDWSHLEYRLIAKTRDDAAGEAYDKVGKLLGLPYPGGPVIDRLARLGNPTRRRFPVAKISDRTLDFSFSGIKTAVLRIVREERLPELDEEASRKDPGRLDLLAGFQEGVVRALVSRTLDAARRLEPRSILLGGGVAANSRLKEAMAEGAAGLGLEVCYPRPALTTDNAAMIAAAGMFRLMRGERSDYALDADPTLKLAPPASPSRRGRWKM
jgi:tRNA N6-adenosine threonylcarbamoyltransferase